MLRFELKKLIKKKTFIWIGLFACLISLLSIFYSYSAGPYIINVDIDGSNFNFTNSLDFDHPSLSHLTFEDRMDFLRKSLDLSMDFSENRQKYNSRLNDEN